MGKEPEVRYRKHTFLQLWKWPSCGWRFFKKHPLLWLVTALCFMLVAMTVGMIPIIGAVLVMFISPIVLASALLWLASPDKQKRRRQKSKAKTFFSRLERTLYGAMRVQENIVPVLILGAFLAVSTIIIQIIGHLIAGPMFPSLAAVTDLSLALAARVVVAKFVVLSLYYFIGMWVLYAIPMIILDDIMLPTAVMKSFRGILINSIGLFTLYFATLTPLILWSFFFSTASLIGFTGFLLLGTGLLSVFISAAYCGYKLTYYQ